MSIPSYIVSAGAHPHMHRCMLVGCSIPVLGTVGYRVCVYAYSCTLHTLHTTRDGTVYMYTTTTLVCSTGDIHQPQDPGTRYACRSGMHTCILCSDVHHVVYIYSTVHRQQQRTYIVYVHSTLHAVQYWSHVASEMAGSTPQHPCIPWSMVCASLYLCTYVGGVVYTSTVS